MFVVHYSRNPREPLAGWTDAGFDDSSWPNTGAPSGYDGQTDPLSSASWIWPTVVYMRTTFDLPAVAAKSAIERIGSVASGSRAAGEYYSLHGQRLGGRARSAFAVVVELREGIDGPARQRLRLGGR